MSVCCMYYHVCDWCLQRSVKGVVCLELELKAVVRYYWYVPGTQPGSFGRTVSILSQCAVSVASWPVSQVGKQLF